MQYIKGGEANQFQLFKTYSVLCVPSNVVVCLGSAKKKVRFALICKKKNMTHLVFVV